VRVTFKFTLDTKTATVGMWLFITGAPTSPDLVELATDLFGIWRDTFLVHQHADATLVEVECRYFTGSGEILGSAFGSQAGLVGGDATPNNTAQLISWQISASYRGGKPRSYIPGVPQSALGSWSTLTDSQVGALTTDAGSFIGLVDDLTPTDIDSVSVGCMHFFSGGAALDPPTFDPFLSGSAQKRLCTQRRRLGAEIF